MDAPLFYTLQNITPGTILDYNPLLKKIIKTYTMSIIQNKNDILDGILHYLLLFPPCLQYYYICVPNMVYYYLCHLLGYK